MVDVNVNPYSDAFYAQEYTANRELETCMEIFPRFPAGNPAVKGTECEGYPREGK